MSDKDRIRLAEAMGWTRHEGDGGSLGLYDYWADPSGETHGKTRVNDLPAFDPFTDANDDYAVLSWLRATPERHSDAIMLLGLPMRRYRIGDYARAALKVLNDD